MQKNDDLSTTDTEETPRDVHTLAMTLAEAALDLDSRSDIGETLEALASWARRIVPGATYAGVALRRGRQRPPEPVAATDDVVTRVDTLQVELDEGPIIDATRENCVVRVADLSLHEDWLGWFGALAEQDAIRSVLTVSLARHDRIYGALTCYSQQPDSFDHTAEVIARALGSHAMVALRAASIELDLTTALGTRHLIGQAQGVLLTRMGLDEDQSFALLSRVSQNSNIRLVELAKRVVQRHDDLGPLLAKA